MKETSGGLSAELAEIAKLMQADPAAAEPRLKALLTQEPADPNATYLYAVCLRLQQKFDDAQSIFERMAAEAPGNPMVLQDLGITYLANGKLLEARDTLGAALKIQPGLALAWQVLADVLTKMGDTNGANKAMQQHQMALAQSQSPQGEDAALSQAKELLKRGETKQAEAICRTLLQENPRNVEAMCLLGATAIQINAIADAKGLFERCLEIAPDHLLSRMSLASAYYRFDEYDEANHHLDIIEMTKPGDPNVTLLRSKISFDVGDYDAALAGYEDLNARFKPVLSTIIEYGHTLRAVGRQSDAIEAYRQAENLDPGRGLPWFSLANLKSQALDKNDIDIIGKHLKAPGLAKADEYHLAFALGSAFEDHEDWDNSFAAYEKANKVQRATLEYDVAVNHEIMETYKRAFDADFVGAHASSGCQAQDPIFIVGLPRSGSTLVEQILASHSEVDGTFELPDINIITRRLDGNPDADERSKYPACLHEMGAEEFKVLGQEYIDRTKARRMGNVYFIDKMPSNFMHIGFIKLALPNAKIIETRRAPMANCFALWKQSFSVARAFSYNFEELGAYYQDYISMMDHWTTLFPGGIMTVSYEELVRDTESQVRAMLDYCGLAFEEACLNPHKTERVVRTASSEQVRRPIYDDALELWKKYETHLGPLKEALGPLA